MPAPLQLDVPSGGKLIDVVRDLARDGRLPLYWRCGQGTCGACVVYLTHEKSALGLPLVMGGKERNVLARLRLLSESERSADSLPDTPDLPRLACHAVLDEGDLHVRW